jgi:hypothetical protein
MRKGVSIFFSSALLATLLVTFSLTTTNAIADETPTPSASPLVATAPTNQTKNPSDTYSLGATGPGGGFIFYINTKGFKCGPNFTTTGSPTGGLCHYLEVAPSGWYDGRPGSTDPRFNTTTPTNYYKPIKGIESINDVCLGYNQPEKCLVKSAIGMGYKNSIAIVNQGNDTKYAAGAVRAYKGGAMSDWYLPNLAELNNLLKWDKGLPWKSDATVVTGGTINSPTYGAAAVGLAEFFYMTSTERIGRTTASPKILYNRMWAIWHIKDQYYFGGVEKDNSTRHDNGINIRPIRAF